MNRKILILVSLTVFVVIWVFALVMSGNRQKNDSGEFIASSLDEEDINACKQVVGEETVFMGSDGYKPKDMSFKLCTKVTFKNDSAEPLWVASDIHPTHGIYPQFDPREPVEAGSEWSFVFYRVGRWKYHDHLNPTIRGVIEVSE